MAKYARNAKSVKARYVTQSTRAVPIILGRDYSSRSSQLSACQCHTAAEPIREREHTDHHHPHATDPLGGGPQEEDPLQLGGQTILTDVASPGSWSRR